MKTTNTVRSVARFLKRTVSLRLVLLFLPLLFSA
jgi:hypothetical protein